MFRVKKSNEERVAMWCEELKLHKDKGKVRVGEAKRKNDKPILEAKGKLDEAITLRDYDKIITCTKQFEKLHDKETEDSKMIISVSMKN